MLVDINRFLKPRLYVIDAIVAMEGNGPRNGHPRKIGAILLSRDPVAADAAGAMLMGMDPANIVTCQLAAKSGLGNCCLDSVEASLIRPENGQTDIKRGQANQLLCELQVRDFVKGRVVRSLFTRSIKVGAPLYKKHVLQRPAAAADLCLRCGVCADACPASPPAITYSAADSLPVFDYARCIRCYCCQETCPPGAINVRITPIGRLIGV